MIETLEFENYESREQEFRKLIFNILPRKYAGVSSFWIDFTANFNSISDFEMGKLAYITSTPSDCIAFATPFQTINAAALTVFESKDKVEEALVKFNLLEIKNQLVRTLSGGESVRLALAKAYIFSDYVDQLVINSPFIWLNPNSESFLNAVINQYSKKRKDVIILTLSGERNNELIENDTYIEGINFKIGFKDVNLNLNPMLELSNNAKQTIAEIENAEIDLISPCLVKGENGSGKSLISMSLSKVLQKKGEATIESNGKKGFARMLFQDVIAQTLNREFDKIIYYSGMKKEGVIEIYDRLLTEYRSHFKKEKKKVPIFSYDSKIGYKTIVEIKFILVAIRILDKPPLLILDEPGWGMTKMSSYALVESVVKISHQDQVAVMIISNHNWFDNIKKSSIYVSKKNNENSLTFNVQKIG